MAFEAEWRDDLDVARVMRTPKVTSHVQQPDIPSESFNPMAYPDLARSDRENMVRNISKKLFPTLLYLICELFSVQMFDLREIKSRRLRSQIGRNRTFTSSHRNIRDNFQSRWIEPISLKVGPIEGQWNAQVLPFIFSFFKSAILSFTFTFFFSYFSQKFDE